MISRKNDFHLLFFFCFVLFLLVIIFAKHITFACCVFTYSTNIGLTFSSLPPSLYLDDLDDVGGERLLFWLAFVVTFVVVKALLLIAAAAAEEEEGATAERGGGGVVVVVVAAVVIGPPPTPAPVATAVVVVVAATTFRQLLLVKNS